MPTTEAAGISDQARAESVDALAKAMGAEIPDATATQPAADDGSGQSSDAQDLDLSGLHETTRKAVLALPDEYRATTLDALRAREKELVADHTRKTQEVSRRARELQPLEQNASIVRSIFESRNPVAIDLLNKAAMAATGLAVPGAGATNGNGNGHDADDDPLAGLFRATDEAGMAKALKAAVRREAQAILAEERESARLKESERSVAIREEATAVRESFGDMLTDDEAAQAWNDAVSKNDPATFSAGRVGPLYMRELARVIASKSKTAPSTAPKPVVSRTATVPGGAEFTSPRSATPWEREKRKPQGGEVVLQVMDELRGQMPGINATAEGLWNLMRPGGRQQGPPRL